MQSLNAGMDLKKLIFLSLALKSLFLQKLMDVFCHQLTFENGCHQEENAVT